MGLRVKMGDSNVPTEFLAFGVKKFETMPFWVHPNHPIRAPGFVPSSELDSCRVRMWNDEAWRPSGGKARWTGPWRGKDGGQNRNMKKWKIAKLRTKWTHEHNRRYLTSDNHVDSLRSLMFIVLVSSCFLITNSSNLFQSEISLHPLHGLRLFPALSQIRQLLCSSAGRRGGIAEGRGSQDLSRQENQDMGVS